MAEEEDGSRCQPPQENKDVLIHAVFLKESDEKFCYEEGSTTDREQVMLDGSAAEFILDMNYVAGTHRFDVILQVNEKKFTYSVKFYTDKDLHEISIGLGEMNS